MSTWKSKELELFANADDLHISPFREDGKTYGTPTWIWSVVMDDALYVRAYNGVKSGWYQAAMQQKVGRISIAGQQHDVTFSAVDDDAINTKIDNAYQIKYADNRYLTAMIGNGPRQATVKISPRHSH